MNINNIADYYNQTLDHYQIWWNLKRSHAVHYGYWDVNTRSFTDALQQTNRVMAYLVDIHAADKILDAGCGVGGAALFLATQYQCEVWGITLSEKQLHLAQQLATQSPVEKKLHFSLQDFTRTNFESNAFDVLWGCESTCYASPKSDFIAEAYRILKPGGRMIIADYFELPAAKSDPNQYMKKWGDLWAIQEFHSAVNFTEKLQQQGFEIAVNQNVTQQITPSAKRMYMSYWIGALPSMLYNLFHRTSRYGKHHYRSGYFQYKALQNKLWEYRILVAVKK